MKSLLSAVESSLADVADAIERSNKTDKLKGIEGLLEAIDSGIADIAVNMESQIDFSPLVNAIKGIKIATPNVTVEAIIPQQPAPIVHVNIPEAGKAKWEVTIHASHGVPERHMSINRTV